MYKVRIRTLVPSFESAYTDEYLQFVEDYRLCTLEGCSRVELHIQGGCIRVYNWAHAIRFEVEQMTEAEIKSKKPRKLPWRAAPED